MGTTRESLEQFFDSLLEPSRFKDYGPNGLQIEGRSEIRRVAFAVSATLDSTTKAVQGGADALVVHHGLFWRFHGAKPLAGPFARRVFPLVRAEVNLFAYHLPLDAHLEIGNAATLAIALEMTELAPFGDHEGLATGVQGRLSVPCTAASLQQRLAAVLAHPVLMASPDPGRTVRSVGIITGGANRDWPLARDAGLDAFVTGEISEHDWHESQEAGIHFFAGGHHATESLGIQALMARVRQQFDLECFFIPSDNPA